MLNIKKYILLHVNRAAGLKETANRRDTLRKIEKYSNKLGRLVDDMEKNVSRDENISTYGKRLLHVVRNSIFFLKKKI
jgi:t-SNARE complex subunit (syntaxin)